MWAIRRSRFLVVLRAAIFSGPRTSLEPPVIYELKVYVPHQGKEAALRSRFIERTLPIFEKSGISVVAMLAPVARPDELWYITRFHNDEMRLEAWANFQSNPEWKAIKAESETDGPLLESQTTTVLNSLDDAFLI
jgi:hypothetical protein